MEVLLKMAKTPTDNSTKYKDRFADQKTAKNVDDKPEWLVKLEMAWDSWLKITLALAVFGILIVLLYAGSLPETWLGIPILGLMLVLPGALMAHYYYQRPWFSMRHKIFAWLTLLAMVAVTAVPLYRAVFPAEAVVEGSLEPGGEIAVPAQAAYQRGWQLQVKGNLPEGQEEVSGSYQIRVGHKHPANIKGDFSRHWTKSNGDQYANSRKLIVRTENYHDFIGDMTHDSVIRLKEKDSTISGPLQVLLRKHPVDLYYFLLFCLPLIVLASLIEGFEPPDVKRSSFSFLVTMVIMFGFLFADYFARGGWLKAIFFAMAGGALLGTAVGWTLPLIIKTLFRKKHSG